MALTIGFSAQPSGRITPPDVDGLTVLGPPSQQSTISIINGARSANTTLNFPVRAEHEGTITIPSFEVETSAGTQTVGALTMQVGPATLPSSRHGAAGATVGAGITALATETGPACSEPARACNCGERVSAFVVGVSDVARVRLLVAATTPGDCLR